MIHPLDQQPIGSASQFRASATSFNIDAIKINRITTSPLRVIKTPRLIRSSADPGMSICLMKRGRAIYEYEGESHYLAPGDVILTDLSKCYAIEFSKTSSLYTIMIPPAIASITLPQARDMTGSMLTSDTGIGSFAIDMLGSLMRRQSELNAGSANSVHIRDTLLHLLCGAYYFDGNSILRLPEQKSNRKFEQLLKFINDHLADHDISLEAIAAEFHISKRQVYQLFAEIGITPARYIWLCRIEQAARKLSNPQNAAETVSTIAFNCGFNNIQHFSKLFKKYYGVAPREYKLHQLKGRSRN